MKSHEVVGSLQTCSHAGKHLPNGGGTPRPPCYPRKAASLIRRRRHTSPGDGGTPSPTGLLQPDGTPYQLAEAEHRNEEHFSERR